MHAMVITLAANYTTRYVSVRAIWHKPCLRNEMSVRCVYTYICLPLYHIGTRQCHPLYHIGTQQCRSLYHIGTQQCYPLYHIGTQHCWGAASHLSLWVPEFRTIVLILTLGLMTASTPLQWRHNESDGVSNHHRHECLLNHLFRRR